MRGLAFALAVLLVGCSSQGTTTDTRPAETGNGGSATALDGGQPSVGGSPGAGGSRAADAGGTGGIPGSGGASAAAGGSGAGGLLTAAGGTPGTGGSSPGTSAGGARATGGITDGGGAGGMAGAGGTGVGPGAGGSPTRPDAASDVREAGATDGNPDVAASDTRVANPDQPASEVNLSTTVTVYVAGDSTVSTYTNSSIHQAGWGQYLQDYFIASAKIVNKAVGGMTARHFIEAGYLEAIVAVLKPGDYLLVQFGTNDGNTTATYTLPGVDGPIPYYLDPQTDFKTYLGKYVDATKGKGATTIFVTPPPRHSCNAGETGVRNGLAAYATAMKELGATLGTPVVDDNAMVIATLANVTCETSGSTFYLVKADGTVDSTHFQDNGANTMAGLIAKGTSGIVTLGLPLSAYVK
jgi:lysophospholipase L1-like esterase